MTSQSPPHSAKPEFWRVRNIKTGDETAAREWLEEQVKELVISEGQGFSLAADSKRTLCATLTSHERPIPPDRGWRVDKDFVGFTPLSDPEDATVDIVAVTGLGGHALVSFRSADGTSVWLRDFAPQDIPQARFITYGYNTNIIDSDNNQGVHELALTLLNGLADFRQRTQTQQGPWLFICHSLGGVVLKEALVISSKTTEPKHKNLLEVMTMTYGLMFLGVPNLGLKHNQLEIVVKGRANEGFVRDLLVKSDSEASQFLGHLTREFSDLDRRRRLAFEIVSYYETESSPTLVDRGGGHFEATGPKEFMVTKMSAERIGHFVRTIDHLPLSTNHRGLVRFEHSQDARYISVIGKLKGMAAEAPVALQLRARSGHFGGEVQGSRSFTPSKYLPFQRNRQFVGRSAELEALEKKLFVEQDCQKAAVVGLGGIGKTQVVLHFAYSVLDRHADVSVFWVPALSVEAFEQAYREIAVVLGIEVAADGKEDVKELVRRRLSTEAAGKWMLVIDNADDMGILDGSDGRDGLLEHIPESESGLKVFTTRNSEIAQSIVGSDVVVLDKMTEAEARDVMRRTLVREEVLRDAASTTELLAELDCLPLAITQAMAYINRNRVSLAGYLDLLKGTEQDMVHLMSTEIRDSTRYKQAANAVATTWLVSFQQLVRQDGDAAGLLQYMACVEWKAIPHSILPAVQPAARMTSAIGTLCSYSFITRREGEKQYDMHRLVHVAARIWADKNGSLADTQRRAMQHLSDIFPSDDWQN
ncbi:hypothetical protein LTR95_015688, partial [Oleoguttula sp. CCFEE 5521]